MSTLYYKRRYLPDGFSTDTLKQRVLGVHRLTIRETAQKRYDAHGHVWGRRPQETVIHHLSLYLRALKKKGCPVVKSSPR